MASQDVPDDDPINDKAMPLLDHLIELRTRLLWSMGAFLICFVFCYYFSRGIYSFLAQPLADILRRNAIEQIDVLHIDTEGFDFEIIKMVAAAKVKPTVVHFEHLLLSDADRQACYTLLAEQGYRLARNGINTIAYLQPIVDSRP